MTLIVSRRLATGLHADNASYELPCEIRYLQEAQLLQRGCAYR